MRLAVKAAAGLWLIALLCAAPASASDFGLSEFDVTFSNPDGSGLEQAGSHPFAMTTALHFNSVAAGEGEELAAAPKDILTAQIPGFVGNPTAVPPCSTADFLASFTNPGGEFVSGCPDATAVGTILTRLSSSVSTLPTYSPVYNLAPPPGKAAKLGFWVRTVPITIELGLAESPPYDVVGGPRNISQVIGVTAAKLTLWGVPGDPAHDSRRGHCLGGSGGSLGTCSASIGERPFITVPRACAGPLATGWAADSWLRPGAKLANGEPDLSDPNWLSGSAPTHDEAGEPKGFSGCGRLGFEPEITAKPTSLAANSPTGLDFSLDINDEGLTNPSYEAVAASDIEKAVVTLPAGMTTNPSLAEGLTTCSQGQLAQMSAFSAPGVGCPDASKIGTVAVETPVLEEKVLKGSLFIATPYENPFHTLLALYVVIQNPELGIKVVQPLEVVPDPVTGQLTTISEGMPQVPFSHFRLHFREGARSPLASPPACGFHTVRALLYPYSGAEPVESTSAFELISGPDSGPCPTGGLPPFKPGLLAGTVNNRAGGFSPFYARISRSDSEQEITHFSIKLPPGVVGKLAGIPFCPDAAIAAAEAREGQPHGGAEELERPSCPAASQVGRTLVGSGVGPSLAYAPGKAYLAGPYHGAPISIAAITAAKVGPFDLGTVVVREALKVNPETGEVFVDATGSDPIPHIIRGIPVHLRDIRVYVDRPEFVLNPTDCEPTSTASTVLGSGLNFASEADDNPLTVTSRFQAADCAALPFAPRLGLKLLGGTKRGGHPRLKATLNMNGIGEASISRAQVTLPRSEFLDQGHIRTVCTRVQFKEGAGNGAGCPPASVYGYARAKTPILSEPLEGPVFLRSSEHKLPDLVAALHGNEINVDLVGRIDSLHGQIRNTFETVPDAPVSSFTLEMQGGSKGLLVNSTNLCTGSHRAIVKFDGHNGKIHDFTPAVGAKCPKPHRHKGKHGHRRHRRAG